MIMKDFEKCFKKDLNWYSEGAVWLLKHGFMPEDSDIEGMGVFEGDVTVDGTEFVSKAVSWDKKWTVSFQYKSSKVVELFMFGENNFMENKQVEQAYRDAIEIIHTKLSKEVK